MPKLTMLRLPLYGLVIAFFLCSAQTAHSQKIKFTGTLYDFDTHEPIAGITVSMQGKKFSTVTDSMGRFTFLLPVDNYTLIFAGLNYANEPHPIFILDKTSEVIYLKKLPPNELQDVTVETTKKDASVKDINVSNVHLNISQLKKTPIIFGETDIIRALTLQPGIITTGETVSSYNVRGGGSDQNLILIDGAPMFNIAHLLGFYSGVSADAVQDVNFYKAGVPAQYGDRLSSFMMLNIKTGNPDSMRYNTGVGFVSSHFFLNGPIVKKKLTIMAGGRIAYPKIMMNLFPGDVSNSNAFYYDAIVKLSYTPNENNRISATFYNSYDTYKFPGDTSYGWKNYIGSLQWKSNISSHLNFTLLGDYSKNVSNINGLVPLYNFVLSSGIEQEEAKGTFNYNFNPDQKLIFGGSFTHYTVSPGEISPSSPGSIITNYALEHENANELSAFLSTENKITNFLELQLGGRFTQYQYLGPKTVYLYTPGVPQTVESIYDTVHYASGKPIKTYSGFEPRLALRILLDKSTSIKMSYNKTQQYLHLISNTTAITPVDYWKLSDPYTLPESANQYAIGLFKNFQDNNYETSIETYYKTIDHIVDYKNGADLNLNPALETQLLPGQGYAYGAELSVRKNRGIITGMASYTYSRTFEKIITPFISEQVNGGAYFPANADRPHNFVLSSSINLGQGWNLSSNFVYTTGRPATFPDGSYIINGTVVANYSERNLDRLPSYNRLDIAFAYDSRRYPQQKKYSVLNFSFYNVYMRQNVYSIYFKRDSFGNLAAYRLSVLGTIIPSISWNYNF